VQWLGRSGKFALTVFEDRSIFDGASRDTIRRHFQQWSVKAYRTEQFPEECSPLEFSGIQIGWGPRYIYAVQVDAGSLCSIVNVAPPEVPDGSERGWVRLINKPWYLGLSETGSCPEFQLELIEGVMEPNVGWIKVQLVDV
jgi:hypothetical protein